MTKQNGTDTGKRTLRSLGELPRDIAPPRDLWPTIEAGLSRTTAGGTSGAGGGWRPTRLHWAALAAVVSALAIGMWLGRSVLPGAMEQPPVNVAASPSQTGGSARDGAGEANGPASATPGTPADASQTNGAQPVLAASFVTDPRYLKQREEMIRALEEQLRTLPPHTQQKVAGSLEIIRASMKDIQAALGRDPANALLQELLVNTYQDEMRVLTAVHEASGAGGGI